MGGGGIRYSIKNLVLIRDSVSENHHNSINSGFSA